ncbi:MAG: DUF4105 domain-containing protein [Cyclobacteriaceae bacterium]|nr:DUF4105 domain-containing protein [Cyclobacteriaceae bacterium]
MKKLLLISVFALLVTQLRAQQLSPAAKVMVLTVSPGHEELYAAFGHSAIYISDPVNRIDRVYNYGTYYYNQPHFYLNFARGYLLYGLSVSTYERFQGYYAYFNRQVVAQYLDLSLDQAQQVYDFLENNALPENSMYYYDYFYDNCATKIRDVFEEVLGSDFKIPEHFTKNPDHTIRQLTDHYIKEEFPWGKLGIDICLGLPMDKALTDNEYMYLPDFLYQGFEAAKIKKDSTWAPAVAAERTLLYSRPMDYPMPWFTPMVAFSALAVMGLLMLLVQIKKGWLFRWFDFTVFFVIGAIGLLLTLLWTATDHHAAADNFNLLWALPSHLIVAFFIIKKSTRRWVNWYMAILLPFYVLLILFWNLIPQDLNDAFIPVVILLVIRAIAILKR